MINSFRKIYAVGHCENASAAQQMKQSAKSVSIA